ncbi:MAG: M42 family metallopeptidase [Planctomycetales bacterium]|nr:M42 family metallopeptidase [Planctomycetales bacterium]
MDGASLQFLKGLLTAPSPSGYEQPVQAVVREHVGSFADRVSTDWHGNVIAAVNPDGSPRIMLAGHCDQIGLMVKYVDEQGFVWVDSIGGWDIQMLIGQNLMIWGRLGPVNGVIARKAIHLLSPDDRKKVPELKDLWIDIGVKNRDEAKEIIAVGDPVTFDLGFRELRNNLAAAPGMDNKVGAWVVMSALQQVAAAASKPKAGVFAVSTVQEEIGLRGAQTSSFSIDAQIGIAVDVTHATDCPTLDNKQHGEIKLGLGPVLYRGPNVNPIVHRRLMELATQHNIPVQNGGLSRAASNDANAMQVSRGGVATGIVAIPNRYMHSPVEVVSLTDLENAAKLIAMFCLSVDQTTDFTP